MIDKLDKIIASMSNVKVINQQMCAIKKLKGRLAQNELIISVIGQFKRGKTALVNAILGEEILPVGIVPLTSVVTKIRNGNTFKAVVHFLDGSSRQILQTELSGFISEQENKNNHKNVDFVDLWYPCNLLGHGVTLVDTPGVGSVHRHNTKASYAFVQKSDAVLFVLSVDSPINELEEEFLLQAEQYASKFYFVVNKVDTIDDASRAEYLAYCKTVLQGVLVKEPVELYPISALTGEGITEVLNVIRRDISSSAGQILQSSICIKAKDVVQEAVSKLDLYASAISLSIEELNEETASLTEKQRELDAMADQTDLLLKQQADKLVEHIELSLSAQIPCIEESVLGELTAAYQKAQEAPSRRLEQVLSEVLDARLRVELERLNEDGFATLSAGYDSIVKALNMKMQEIKQYVAQMIQEFFGVSYQYEAKEYSVSERSDFFFRINVASGKYFLDVDELTHLLPRRFANPRIYEKIVARLEKDLQANINNMVYNYRYKMQESIRTLCTDFIADVSAIQSELSQVLHAARASVESEGKIAKEQTREIQRIRAELAAQVQKLDCAYNCLAILPESNTGREDI